MQETLRAIGGAVGQVAVLAAEQGHLRDLFERVEKENADAHHQVLDKLRDLDAKQTLTSQAVNAIQMDAARQEGERSARAADLARQAWTRPALASLATAIMVSVLNKVLT